MARCWSGVVVIYTIMVTGIFMQVHNVYMMIYKHCYEYRRNAWMPLDICIFGVYNTPNIPNGIVTEYLIYLFVEAGHDGLFIKDDYCYRQ